MLIKYSAFSVCCDLKIGLTRLKGIRIFREFYIVARLVQLFLQIYFGALYLFYCIYCALLRINI